MSREDRYKVSKKVSIISIFVNVILSIFKILVGYLSSSQALIADGLHSVSDMASTLIIMVSIRFSRTPADEDHPYGHGKAESIGTVILALILIFTGFALIKDTGFNILNGELVVPGRIALLIAFLSIVTKETLYQYTIRAGKKINSKGLIADAHHHRSDALSSIAALIGIGGARLGIKILDPLAGLIVALFIVKIGFDIFKEAVHELMDGTPDEKKIAVVRATATHVKGVSDVGQIRFRTYGPKVYIDLELAVSSSLSVGEGHQIATDVKEKIMELDNQIGDVMIHVDPDGVR